jgi:hypothetical protein
MVIIFEILWGSDLFVVQEIGFLITAGFETGGGGVSATLVRAGGGDRCLFALCFSVRAQLIGCYNPAA